VEQLVEQRVRAADEEAADEGAQRHHPGDRPAGERVGQDAERGTFAGAPETDELPPAVAHTVALIAANICPDVPPPVLARGLGAWIQLFGAVSFELFGQLATVVDDPRAFFDHQMRAQARYVGI